jgi:hypothetical protein
MIAPRISKSAAPPPGHRAGFLERIWERIWERIRALLMTVVTARF